MPVDNFMRIDGILGSGQHPNHVGEIEVSGFRWQPMPRHTSGITARPTPLNHLMYLMLPSKFDRDKLLNTLNERQRFRMVSLVKYSFDDIPERLLKAIWMYDVRVAGPVDGASQQYVEAIWSGQPGYVLVLQYESIEINSYGPEEPILPPQSAAGFALSQIMHAFMLDRAP